MLLHVPDAQVQKASVYILLPSLLVMFAYALYVTLAKSKTKHLKSYGQASSAICAL